MSNIPSKISHQAYIIAVFGPPMLLAYAALIPTVTQLCRVLNSTRLLRIIVTLLRKRYGGVTLLRFC
jgi:hypothetical protein